MAAQQDATIEDLSTILAESYAEIDSEIDLASDVDKLRGPKSSTDDDFDPEEPNDSDEDNLKPGICIPEQLLQNVEDNITA